MFFNGEYFGDQLWQFNIIGKASLTDVDMTYLLQVFLGTNG